MLPSGTITFLFTDIQGSTPFWEQHPGEMHIALEQHNAILQRVMAEHNGQVFKIVGDEFQVAFTDASQAVIAAVEAQRQLTRAEWPEVTGMLQVRMGIHTGDAQADGSSDYISTHTLNRVARISSAGHGGQILISLVSSELARDALERGVLFRDMGEHHLKGMSQVEHIFQVEAPGLEKDFPSLTTLTKPNHNLPRMRSAFIGREREISRVMSLMDNSRLVTLIGVGGVGKTRLSLQVAHELLDDFSEGVWWVELAQVSDPERVADAVAEVLSVHEQADRSLIETLETELCSDKHLLILDNCEHLVDACAHLVDRLLRSCPNLQVMTTSREPLHVEGELTFPLPTLSLPKDDKADVDSMMSSEAVQLFVERARATLPEFKLTEANHLAVMQICQQLDGIPLAIELAAARIPVMQVSQLVVRLDRVFRLLTGGSRTAMPRQQTLQATIDWSYQLLSQGERNLFERLSVFSGGWTLEAASSICTDEEIDQFLAFDLLTNLVDKSLVILDRRPGKEGHYRFLETIRQYARDKLEQKGQVDQYRKRHLDYFLAYAEDRAAQLRGVDQVEALRQMETEIDNLRTAMSSSLTDLDTIEESVRLAIALGSFWRLRGNLHEGRSWMSEVLKRDTTRAYPELSARALDLAANMAYNQSDYPASKALWEESLVISRQLGSNGLQGVQEALTGLAMVATELGDYETAPQLLTEALEITSQLGYEPGEANILRNLGWAAMRPGDYQLAREYLEAAEALYRKLNDKVGLASTLSGLGEAALRQGDLERSKMLLEESLQLRRELDHKWGIGASLGTLGWIALSAGNYQDARRILHESLDVRQALGDKGGLAWCLEKLALTAQFRGYLKQAAKLYGAAAALRESIKSVIDPADQSEYEQQIANLKTELGDEQFLAHWCDGEAMNLNEVIAISSEKQLE